MFCFLKNQMLYLTFREPWSREMSMQQGTKAPFLLSLFFSAVGAKAKTDGTTQVAGQSPASWQSLYQQISMGSKAAMT